MNRARLRLLAVVSLGVLAITTGVATGVLSPASTPDGTPSSAILATLVVLAVGAWSLFSSGSASDDAAVPWSEGRAIVEQAPEELPEETTLSGGTLTRRVERAGAIARRERSVDGGLAEIRPVLRAVLVRVLVAGGTAESTVETALAEGTWTDDRTAAAVLDEGVDPPELSFRRRLRGWLFPEREARRRARRAVAAIAAAADDTLPPVVGQDAPRTAPVTTPTLDDLQRTADGRLQRAESVTAAGTTAAGGDDRGRATRTRGEATAVGSAGGEPATSAEPGTERASAPTTGDSGRDHSADDWDDVGEPGAETRQRGETRPGGSDR